MAEIIEFNNRANSCCQNKAIIDKGVTIAFNNYVKALSSYRLLKNRKFVLFRDKRISKAIFKVEKSLSVLEEKTLLVSNS